MKKKFYKSFILIILSLITSCGALNSTTAILDAKSAIKEAKNAEAQTYAPYEYTKAVLYLKKAKELQGYSEYQQAVLYAIKAKDLALNSINLSKKNKAKIERLKEFQTKIKK